MNTLKQTKKTSLVKITLFILCNLLLYSNKVFCQSYASQKTQSAVCTTVVEDLYYNFQLDSTADWPNTCSLHDDGQEVILQFYANCTDTYHFELDEFNYIVNAHALSYRVSTGNCTPGGFICLSPTTQSTQISSHTNYYEMQLTQGITYDIKIEYNYWAALPIISGIRTKINRSHLTNINNSNAININPDSLTFVFPNIQSSVIIEYGPNFFTPGVDSTPGINGTIIDNITSPFTIKGLTPDSVYNFYFRDHCNNKFSPNSDVIRIRIPPTDSSLLHITDCNNSNYSAILWGYYNYFPGSWFNTSCWSFCKATSPEKIVKFTPDSTGKYYLNSNNTCGQGSLMLMKKKSTLGINESNWECLIDGPSDMPFSTYLGQLDKDTTYYIMVKSFQDIYCSASNFTANFNIQNCNTCPILPSFSILNLTTNSLTFVLREGDNIGKFFIEYGPSGFTPGIDSLPGTNGIVIKPANAYCNINISNLQPGTSYDFYIRQLCDSLGLFSVNSAVRTFTTYPICSIAPDSITSNRPNNTICKGQNIMLTASGGLLSQVGQLKWTKDSCNGPTVFSPPGNYLFFYPTKSGYYFVKPVDTCATLPCVSIFVNVNELPVVNITNPPIIKICENDTVQINATNDSTWTYTWYRNSTLLNTSNQSNLSTSDGGFYNVQVSDSNSCKSISNTTNIRVVCFNPVANNDKLELTSSINNFKLLLAPNPVTQRLNCTFSQPLNNFRISIYNSKGILIYNNYYKDETSIMDINLENQNTGIYYLLIESSNLSSGTKFVINK